MAQVCTQEAMVVKVALPATLAGDTWSCAGGGSSPRRPIDWLPQHQAAPAVSTAHEWIPPAATALNRCRLAIRTGVDRLLRLESPS